MRKGGGRRRGAVGGPGSAVAAIKCYRASVHKQRLRLFPSIQKETKDTRPGPKTTAAVTATAATATTAATTTTKHVAFQI